MQMCGWQSSALEGARKQVGPSPSELLVRGESEWSVLCRDAEKVGYQRDSLYASALILLWARSSTSSDFQQQDLWSRAHEKCWV